MSACFLLVAVLVIAVAAGAEQEQRVCPLLRRDLRRACHVTGDPLLAGHRLASLVRAAVSFGCGAGITSFLFLVTVGGCLVVLSHGGNAALRAQARARRETNSRGVTVTAGYRAGG